MEYTTLWRSIWGPLSSTPRSYAARAKGRKSWGTPIRGAIGTGRFWRGKFTPRPTRTIRTLGARTERRSNSYRWEYDTPIEKTLRPLTDVVRGGRIWYLGPSSMLANQFAEALHAGERESRESFVSMQHYYNPAYREEEREMLPLYEREGIGAIPWSPLAQGFLARSVSDLDATDW